MGKTANEEIQLDPDEMEDIAIVPLKGKTVSLGQPLQNKKQKPQPRKPVKQKPTPLSAWADTAQAEYDSVECDRNVHLAKGQIRNHKNDQAVIEIKELQKMKRYRSKKDKELSDLVMKHQGRKINAIKKRIDDIEAAAALSESDI